MNEIWLVNGIVFFIVYAFLYVVSTKARKVGIYYGFISTLLMTSVLFFSIYCAAQWLKYPVVSGVSQFIGVFLLLIFLIFELKQGLKTHG